jgi:hypothetical protein
MFYDSSFGITSLSQHAFFEVLSESKKQGPHPKTVSGRVKPKELQECKKMNAAEPIR